LGSPAAISGLSVVFSYLEDLAGSLAVIDDAATGEIGRIGFEILVEPGTVNGLPQVRLGNDRARVPLFESIASSLRELALKLRQMGHVRATFSHRGTTRQGQLTGNESLGDG
jgi:hypothetical protein